MGIYTKQMLLSEGCIYRSDKYKGKPDSISISIHAEGDTKKNEGYIKDPYIKVEKSSSYSSATEELRFSMKTEKIIIHSEKSR